MPYAELLVNIRNYKRNAESLLIKNGDKFEKWIKK